MEDTTIHYYDNYDHMTASRDAMGWMSYYSYDSNGNMLSKGSTNYAWSPVNALNNVYATTTVSYGYDLSGKRIQRINSDLTTNYFYDGINVLMEKYHSTEGPTSFTKAAYTLSPGLIGHILSVRQVNSSSTTDFWYHYDPIGNVLFLTDSTGTIHTSYVQEGFGNVIATDGEAENTYHLTTKELDPDIELYYFVARWYEPVVGRFITREPVGQGNIGGCASGSGSIIYLFGQNRDYVYVANDPINDTDTHGFAPNWKKECEKKISNAIGTIDDAAKKNACCATGLGGANNAGRINIIRGSPCAKNAPGCTIKGVIYITKRGCDESGWPLVCTLLHEWYHYDTPGQGTEDGANDFAKRCFKWCK